ncbi:hypothetical protein ACVOMV_09240 [Mesorhizobium atlanticum]
MQVDDAHHLQRRRRLSAWLWRRRHEGGGLGVHGDAPLLIANVVPGKAGVHVTGRQHTISDIAGT